MAMFQGFNPYGGYGVPPQMNQQMVQQTVQGYPQQYQAQQMMAAQTQQIQQPPVTARPVTNYTEVEAAQIPFDNTINLFVNMASGEIYMKRFDPNSGRAPIIVYRQEQPKPVQSAAEEQKQYATVEMVAAIEERLNELADAITTKRTRGAKSDE